NLNHQKITEEDIEKGRLAYSHDLLVEIDRELSDVLPETRDIHYHFIDDESKMNVDRLCALIESAGVEQNDADKVIDFLFYYGVIGLRTLDSEYYIYSVNYDLRMLKIRVQRAGSSALYVVNPAFWPALEINVTH